jgi:hypothetical protein
VITLDLGKHESEDVEIVQPDAAATVEVEEQPKVEVDEI